MRTTITGVGLALFLVASSPALAQPDDRYQFRATSAFGAPTTERIARVFLDSMPGTNGDPESLSGWSYGLCHDPGVAALVAVEDGATTLTVNGGMEPGFNAINEMPVGGDGFTVGVLIDFFAMNDLPPGVGYELNLAHYQMIGAIGQSAPLIFCDTLGSPPIEATVVEDGIASIEPARVSGSLEIGPFFDFIRGDCDRSAGVNLSDVILLLNFLFPQMGPLPSLGCMDACDGSDDEALNLSDVIFILNATFGMPSVPLVAPYPDCGDDPTAGILDCSQATPCP